MDVFKMSRAWFDWCFENPELVSPNHSAVYFFAIEHCNRLGWKKKFGFPSQMAMEAVGIKSYNTYIKTFNNLVEWGFFDLLEKSKNQYSANIIALSNFDKALNKALDKAMIKHTTKRCESKSSINIQETNIHKTKEKDKKENLPIPDFIDAELWHDFLEIRKKQKAVNSDRALKSLIKILSQNPTEANAMIEQSVVNSWKGIFQIKNNQQRTQTKIENCFGS